MFDQQASLRQGERCSRERVDLSGAHPFEVAREIVETQNDVRARPRDQLVAPVEKRRGSAAVGIRTATPAARVVDVGALRPVAVGIAIEPAFHVHGAVVVEVSDDRFESEPASRRHPSRESALRAALIGVAVSVGARPGVG